MNKVLFSVDDKQRSRFEYLINKNKRWGISKGIIGGYKSPINGDFIREPAYIATARNLQNFKLKHEGFFTNQETFLSINSKTKDCYLCHMNINSSNISELPTPLGKWTEVSQREALTNLDGYTHFLETNRYYIAK